MERAELLIGIGERLKEACQEDGRSLSAIARDANIARTTLHGILNGKMKMSVVLLANLCRTLEISADWILYGKDW